MLPMSVGSQAAPFAMGGIHGAQAQAARLGHGHLRMKDAGRGGPYRRCACGQAVGPGYGLRSHRAVCLQTRTQGPGVSASEAVQALKAACRRVHASKIQSEVTRARHGIEAHRLCIRKTQGLIQPLRSLELG